MPNISGRDSSGVSSNIYGLGDVPEPGDDEEDEVLDEELINEWNTKVNTLISN